MEVRKKNDMFEFLPSNTNSYGSLFSINVQRKIINNGSAYMARKTEHMNDTNNQDRHKKLKFDEDITTYMYNEENEKEKNKTNKKSKKEKN